MNCILLHKADIPITHLVHNMESKSLFLIITWCQTIGW